MVMVSAWLRHYPSLKHPMGMDDDDDDDHGFACTGRGFMSQD